MNEDNALLPKLLRQKIAELQHRLEEYDRLRSQLEASKALLKTLEQPATRRGGPTTIQALVMVFESVPGAVYTVEEVLKLMKSFGWNTTASRPSEIVRTAFRRDPRFEKMGKNQYRMKTEAVHTVQAKGVKFYGGGSPRQVAEKGGLGFTHRGGRVYSGP